MSDEIGRPFELTKKRGTYCPHRAPEVCGEDRTVTCRSCGATLDPIAVLLMQAQHRERIIFENRHLVNERERLRAELAELKKDKRNTLSRIRRNTPRPDPAPPELKPGAMVFKLEPVQPVRGKP